MSQDQNAQLNQSPEVISQIVQDDGTFPNNAAVPLLVYQGAVTIAGRDPAAVFEELFSANQWGSSWRNGIFGFHHYHSTAHEVLGVYGGTAKVQLGGEQGAVFEIKAGDVIIIPAGVAHKNLGSSRDFRIVGAYPRGQSPDMCYGKPGERPEADQQIAGVTMPQADPVYGAQGGLREYWVTPD
jgi:uncharacterized protein YjlB